MLYRINYNNQEILLIQTGTVGGVVIHYIVQNERPNKKIIELKQLTAKFSFIDSIGILFLVMEYATVLMAAAASASLNTLPYFFEQTFRFCSNNICISIEGYYTRTIYLFIMY
jgi:hypothetical protein